MTRTVNTYCQWHFGDNLVHLNFLRKQAIAHPDILFVHYCDPKQHQQLAEVISDLPNLKVCGEEIPKDAIDAWINTGAKHMGPNGWDQKGYLDTHKHRWDWVNFHLNWFARLSKLMQLENPVKTPMDLLFDVPNIHKSKAGGKDFDFLIINSKPASGQLPSFHDFCFDQLIFRVRGRGYSVACTQNTHIQGCFVTSQNQYSLLDIGNLSLRVKYIVGVSTGPIWLCSNIWNVESVKYRIVIHGQPMRVHLPGHGCHVSSVDQAIQKLQELRLI